MTFVARSCPFTVSAQSNYLCLYIRNIKVCSVLYNYREKKKKTIKKHLGSKTSSPLINKNKADFQFDLPTFQLLAYRVKSRLGVKPRIEQKLM